MAHMLGGTGWSFRSVKKVWLCLKLCNHWTTNGNTPSAAGSLFLLSISAEQVIAAAERGLMRRRHLVKVKDDHVAHLTAFHETWCHQTPFGRPSW
jgi:hypothetical protein